MLPAHQSYLGSHEELVQVVSIKPSLVHPAGLHNNTIIQPQEEVVKLILRQFKLSTVLCADLLLRSI